MATKTKPAAAPTPAELRALIAATVAHYFPHHTDASLILIPAPGVGPVEMHVKGEVMRSVGGGHFDDWFPVRWETDAESAVRTCLPRSTG